MVSLLYSWSLFPGAKKHCKVCNLFATEMLWKYKCWVCQRVISFNMLPFNRKMFAFSCWTVRDQKCLITDQFLLVSKICMVIILVYVSLLRQTVGNILAIRQSGPIFQALNIQLVPKNWPLFCGVVSRTARGGFPCANVLYSERRLQVLVCEGPSCASTWRTFLCQSPLLCDHCTAACFKWWHMKGFPVPKKFPLFVEIYRRIWNIGKWKPSMC